MSHTPPHSLRHLIVGHLSLAVLFLGGFYLLFIGTGATGSDLASRRAAIEQSQPELILIGNSLMRAAVDGEQFSALSGMRTLTATSNGSSSLWWYLYVKNVVAKARHKPQYVGIMFRDSMLTEPEFRVTGSYQKPIRQLMTSHEPLVRDLSFDDDVLDDINSPLSWVPRESRNWLNSKIEKRTANVVRIREADARVALKTVFAPEKMQQVTYDEFQLAYEEIADPISFDFRSRVEESYLPAMLHILKQQGITPIFLRAKKRRDLDPTAEPPEVIAYIEDLKCYLSEHDAVLLDFTHDTRITEAHFGPGDHLSHQSGRPLFMQLLSEQMLPTLVAHNSRVNSSKSTPATATAPTVPETRLR